MNGATRFHVPGLKTYSADWSLISSMMAMCHGAMSDSDLTSASFMPQLPDISSSAKRPAITGRFVELDEAGRHCLASHDLHFWIERRPD